MADAASDASPDGVIPPPVLVCLHWLGGSARSWDRLASLLAPFIETVQVDLPGFGDAGHRDGRDVASMAEEVIATVRSHAPARWMLAGHSMGAKVAAAVARAAEDGRDGLAGLSHLVLLAGSPPAPEPMAEERRAAMLDWFRGDEAERRREAQGLIDGNVGEPLDADTNAETLNEVLRLNRHAWVSWLEAGSREDWAERIGSLAIPALIVAGEKDGDLGPEGQRRLMLRHFARPTFVTLSDAGHLLPVERTESIAALILRHAGLPGLAAAGAAYRRLIGSDRVGARTRAILVERAAGDEPAGPPQSLSADERDKLRAVVDRIVPLPDAETGLDIAARIDRDLASQPGDGWRFADLPPDLEAYRAGLATLQREATHVHGTAFAALSAEDRDALLARVAEGRVDGAGPLSGAQMKLWFADLCANAVRVYVSHPATLARLGYSGIAYGGDGRRLQGFAEVGIGRSEPWEPTPYRGEPS